MFNPKAKTHTIELRWKVQKVDSNKDRIIYQKAKKSNEDLKTFITERKDATIALDFLIDGIDFGLWLNLNYFTRKVIGTNYSNNITYTLNFGSFGNTNFYAQKIILKRIIGQLVTLEECMDSTRFWEPKLTETELEKKGKEIMDDENQNTMLYCSACCGDRLCGYFGIRVYQTNSHVIWYLDLGPIKQKIHFEKANYFHGFEAYINLINHELKTLGKGTVSIKDQGEQIIDINTKVDLLVKKHQINKNSFDMPQLKAILKTGSIDDINTGIYLATTLGFDIAELAKEIEDSYKKLSDEEKNSISWKIHDNSEFLSTVELYHPALAKKAFLLWG